MVNIMYVDDASGETQYFDCPYNEEELAKMVYEISEKGEGEVRWKIEPQILFLAYCQRWIKARIKPINEKKYQEERKKLKDFKVMLLKLYMDSHEEALNEFAGICPEIIDDETLE